MKILRLKPFVKMSPAHEREATRYRKKLAALPDLIRTARLVVEYFGDSRIDDLLDCDIRLRESAVNALSKAGIRTRTYAASSR
jgi:hypothetical protein